MSCNGCRVLRKGCSDSCILRPCIQWIDTPQAQGHATLFVAKFFGRAGLMSFISGVPQSQRPALFQSLLFEACGRTVNPVNGAMGLLWTGNWHVCQAAVETVLGGGTLRQLKTQESDETSEVTAPYMFKLQETATNSNRRFSCSRSKVIRVEEEFTQFQPSDLDLCLTGNGVPDNRRTETLSEESVTTTTCFESEFADQQADQKLLNLFL